MLEAIDQLPLAVALRRGVYLYPLVNALHIAGLGALITSAALMDLRILGWGRRVPLVDAVALLRPVAMGAFGLAAVTGALLFSVRPVAYAGNPVFLVKLTLLALALANAAVFVLFRRDLRPHSPLTKAMALASLMSWTAVLFSGRLIGFFGME